ncbi:MAG: hypothetical protein O2960_21830 [Verrucomicrobia bacterium]|nr:hypothetical protein [Verrucomicrobiota bacterium]
MKIRHIVPLIVLFCATLLSSPPALAQFPQQGPKLVGTGGQIEQLPQLSNDASPSAKPEAFCIE